MSAPDPETLQKLQAAVAEAVAPWEFSTFAVCRHVGRFPDGCETDEQQLAFKRALADAIAAHVRALWPGTTRALQQDADLVILISWPRPVCEIDVNPLFVYGRYRKFSRCMPNTHWPCRVCRGKGHWRGARCDRCNGSGRMYARSIEDALAAELVPATGATGRRMHSCGREDIDARMLGRGRPFAMELLRPSRRAIDLPGVQQRVNAARRHELALSELTIVDRRIIPLLCDVQPTKSYEPLIALSEAVSARRLAQLPALGRVWLVQRTPRRIAHRRPNLWRGRWIEIVSVRPASGEDSFERLPRGSASRVRLFRLLLRAQSGAYIKEFISGDVGRTSPSLPDFLGVGTRCILLDVTSVEYDPLALWWPSAAPFPSEL